MNAKYRDRAHVFALYIREAHPTDGRQVQANVLDNILIQDPKTIEERRKVAREFASQFKFSLPILVDTLDDQVEKAYAGWPDRIYVIDAEGKIAYKGGPGPRGFIVAEADAALAKLLGDTPPAGAPSLPPAVRERALALLSRAGLEGKESSTALDALARKMDAFRLLQDARRALAGDFDAEGADRAVAAFAAAQKAYHGLVDKVDAELGQTLNLAARPQVRARLVGLGLLGVSPAAPLPGLFGAPPRPE